MKKRVLIFIASLGILSCKNDISTISELKSDFFDYKEKALHIGENLTIQFGANQNKIDSVELILNGKSYPNNVKLDFSNVNLGLNKLEMKVYVDGNSIYADTQLPVLNSEKETPIEYNVIKEYPHNPELFTQGLFYHNNQLYESAGQFKRSKLVTYKLGSTTYNQEVKQSDDIFAEGATLLKDKIYQLTYRQKKIFVYDTQTLQLVNTLRMPDIVREGWGLTSNGKELLISDGSQNIYFFDESLNFVRKIQVAGYVSIYTNINEMEYINERIYANVWTTNFVLVINPETGAVERYYDFTPISETKGSDDVLNGIASVGKNIIVTGKNWSKLYEIENKNQE